jgi:hypothetical protein
MREEGNYEGHYTLEKFERGGKITYVISRVDGRDITPAELKRLKKLLRIPPEPEDLTLERQS